MVPHYHAQKISSYEVVYISYDKYTNGQMEEVVKAPYVLENKTNGVNQNLPVSNLCICNSVMYTILGI